MVLLVLTAITIGFGLCAWWIVLKLPSNRTVRNVLTGITSILAVASSIALNDKLRGLEFLSNHRIPILLIVSAIMVIFSIFVLRKLSGWLISLGILSNLIAIAGNGWKMPVFKGWYNYSNTILKEIGDLHIVMTQSDNFKFFADYVTIRIELPFLEMADTWSPGDLLIITGSFLLYKSVLKLWIESRKTN